MPEVRDFLMPDLGEGLTEGEIVRWLVAEGDVVSVDQPIAEVSTEKALVQVPTPFAGRVARLHGAEGELIAVGTPLISIDVSAAAAEPAGSGNVLVGYGTNEEQPSRRPRAVSRAPAPAASGPAATGTPPAASPLVRRLAAERGIDLTGVTGTGPDGIITRADLERLRPEAGGTADGAAAAAMEGTRSRLTGVHRVAAERLTRSHREAPAATAWLAADATSLLAARARLDGGHGAHITPFAVLLRLCVLALRRFPGLNAHFDGESREIVRFDAVHLGVAVQTERGLVVPVIRDADRRSSRDLAAELERLARSVRDASATAEELSGSTFTVSNFGAFGVDGGTAIINPPEAAILGVGRIVERPWARDGALAARPVVNLSLAFDHRVADGALAGGFLRHLGDLVESAERAVADD
jgi:pyruvate dehydrogenase E2 component (dihydrolipoamide acetyltransferase)